MDGSGDTSTEAFAVDGAKTSDGVVGIDLQPFDLGSEGGAAACMEAAACTGQTGCSSGDDVDIGCRSFLVCQSGTLKAQRSYFIPCGATSASACPATQPGEGVACTLQGQTCSYSTGTCTCATGCESPIDAGPCSKPKTWHCDPLPPTGCPTQAPQLGAPCLDGKAVCAYGKYCYQYEVSCQGGYWEPYGPSPFGGCA
jgi:hypothetical protein